jgi:1-phosphatidylinositol phosphodiesterase
MASSLAESALTEILKRGAPILGLIEHLNSHSKLSSWMNKYPDETKLVHINLPGTHDTCTCNGSSVPACLTTDRDCTGNYTPELQESLERYTGPSV